MTRKRVMILGIVIVLAYLCITIGLIVSGQSIWVDAMEIVTIISALFIPLFVVFMPLDYKDRAREVRILAYLMATGCMILSVGAHMVSLCVTRNLQQKGVELPDYLLIGQWPSMEMTVDYIGWGLFMGLAFLFASLAMNKEYSQIKITALVCGVLCLVGFFGTFLINENLWYIAPLGYGLGSLVLCIEILIKHIDN